MRNRGHQPRRPVLRRDYHPPNWLVDDISLCFELDAEATRVKAALQVRRNPDSGQPRAPLTLDGVDLEIVSLRVDGEPVGERHRRVDGETLVLARVPDQALIESEVIIRPARNTALEGLYVSGDVLLTQCEAEGFRKITWFPDRPDVMTTYRVRLEGDARRCPVLLSNGNCVASGALADGRHFAEWHDPFPKPGYLFAVVAGDLECITDRFVTADGRAVTLKIYSERENLDRLDHAMASLKRAMRWDEERYGLHYDLDVFHVVATDDFNMGAMENKGLNIFNARYVLADSTTATDRDYQAIESVIGHEYFHNWTGNRVTCRDWFQLTLKEGLTVFRDQGFSADMQSAAVKRIEDVRQLRQRQFPEDAGPMAHPVRPERYLEINNFYTATVYEKGAEVVRMYQTLLGQDGFRKGLDLYFRRHDGQAVTCDEFLAAMADANDRDLTQFARWYRQVGTPVLAISTRWDPGRGELHVHCHQSLPPHNDNRDIGPLLIPMILGVLDRRGRPQPVTLAGEPEPGPTSRLLRLNAAEQTFILAGLEEEPLLSVLREFSAPVRLVYERDDADLALLLAHDPDPVARWDAGQILACGIVLRAVERGGLADDDVGRLAWAWASILADNTLDPALVAELITLPEETELADHMPQVDVEGLHRARHDLLRALGRQLLDPLLQRWRALDHGHSWQSSPQAMAERRLKHAILSVLVTQGGEWLDTVAARLGTADNMTDQVGMLRLLVKESAPEADQALSAFEQRWHANNLVMDKWFALQASWPGAGTVERVRALLQHPCFTLRNPNRVRALLGTFSNNNPLAFHRADGAGYQLHAEQVLALDDLNPQVAARMASAFNRWRRHTPARQAHMQAALERIRAKKGLSPDVEEIVVSALERSAL